MREEEKRFCFYSEGETKQQQRKKILSWPLGIAYNNIQITYRNTSLKSSTKEENGASVICLQMGMFEEYGRVVECIEMKKSQIQGKQFLTKVTSLHITNNFPTFISVYIL
jgi:hypothetical protein